eukprot:TRINITY_DN8839_c0_g1_i2.p2 TRINITY_DN8839_c0_g1~~TRINITY_DN8839_c0_g1_i2.p2  ORF type:complete len:166 (-),score=39.03 TRINITY_DN8839_c0_g1_i2:40-537(-)
MLSLRLLPRLIRSPLSLLFSTKEPVPSTSKHIAKLITFHVSYNGLPQSKYSEANVAIYGCRVIEHMAACFRENPKILTHEHLRVAFSRIAQVKMELTQEFWDVIFPYARALVTTADRETADIMASVLLALSQMLIPVSYTHLRAHETDSYLVCRLLLEKKKKKKK